MEHANDSSRIQSSPTITLSGDGDGWSHNRPLMNRKLGFQLRCTEFVTVIDSIGLRGSESIRMNKHGGSISKIHEGKCDVTIRRLNAQCCLPIGSRPNVQRLTMATSSLSLSLSLSLSVLLCCYQRSKNPPSRLNNTNSLAHCPFPPPLGSESISARRLAEFDSTNLLRQLWRTTSIFIYLFNFFSTCMIIKQQRK